jgi:Zn-dependent M28 family amino/carboxypeptidase
MRQLGGLIAALFLLAAANTPLPTGASAIYRDIAVLSDDALAGRAPGTPGGAAAMAYVIRRFTAVGLSPGLPKGSWTQPVTVEGKASANIIGRLPGTSASNEAVVITAHWDHLGLCKPAGSPDRICNGAIDNASGVALMIEVARLTATGARPSRTILFVATTGEEEGLLGARAFVAAPVVPLDHIVAEINLDTVATAPAGAPVGIVGRGLTRLDPIVDTETRRLGRRVETSRWANRFVKRQDGWAFLQAGVPAIMVGGNAGDKPTLEAFLNGRYHHPDDDLAHLPSLAGAAEDSLLLAAIVRAFADPNRLPRSSAALAAPAR